MMKRKPTEVSFGLEEYMEVDLKILSELIDKVSAYNCNPSYILYDYLPKIYQEEVRIENGKEIWRGFEVLRLK